MKAELKGNNLVLTIPVNDAKNLPLSSSGKTFIVASTNGNVATPVTVNDQSLVIGLNAYIRNPDYVPPENGDGAAAKGGKKAIAGRYGRPEGVTA